MNDDIRAAIAALDWSTYEGSLPKEGAVYPKGQDRFELIGRIRRAFRGIKLRQPA